MAVVYNQWSSAVPFMGAPPSGLAPNDALRIRAYDVYEQMYWNHPETFKLLQRGEDSNPIYLPSAKKIVEATNRFLAVDWDFVVNPRVGLGPDQDLTNAWFRSIFKRERMYAKFAMTRRHGLIWGDTVWHVTANPAKPAGARISISSLHPSRYFPIYNGDVLVGCHLVDLAPDPKDDTKSVHRRQTYRKGGSKGVLAGITTELALFELGKWDDRTLKPADIKKIAQIVPETPLPPAIDSLPVYHIKTKEAPGNNFGSSIIRGVETVIAAANQAVTDEDLALAMAGLGVFWTDAAPPVDDAGQEMDWEIGPARVLEVPPGKNVGRLAGVSSVSPSQEHIKFVLGEAQTGAGVPDIAAGIVDVAVAQSGISLRLQLAPILAGNAELESEMLPVYDHMLFDLARKWLPSYEAFQGAMACEVASVVGDPLPVDTDAELKRIMDLVAAKIITVEEARAKLAGIGYDFGADGLDKLVQQERALAEARSYDPFTNRYNSELEGGTSDQTASGAVKA